MNVFPRVLSCPNTQLEPEHCKILSLLDVALWYRVAQHTVKVEGNGVGHTSCVPTVPYSDVTGFTALNVTTLEVSVLAIGVPHMFHLLKFRIPPGPCNWLTTRPYSE